jgi:hypothetical protein
MLVRGNIMVVHSGKYMSQLLRNIIASQNIKNIMWLTTCESNLTIMSEYNEINYLKFGDNVHKSSLFLVFDIFLIPTVCLFIRYKNCSFGFVQHGVFSQLLAQRRRQKFQLSWIISRLRFFWFYVTNTGAPLKSLLVLSRIFFKGSGPFIEIFVDYIPSFKFCIFWSRADYVHLSEQISDKLSNVQICKSPDSDLLDITYDPDGRDIFVSQPLVEDGLISEDAYKAFLAAKDLANTSVIKHPRDTFVYENEIELSEVVGLKCRKVFGCFSSLLLSVPPQIPIDLWDFNEANLGPIVSAFRHNINSRREIDSQSFWVALKRVL